MYQNCEKQKLCCQHIKDVVYLCQQIGLPTTLAELEEKLSQEIHMEFEVARMEPLFANKEEYLRELSKDLKGWYIRNDELERGKITDGRADRKLCHYRIYGKGERDRRGFDHLPEG